MSRRAGLGGAKLVVGIWLASASSGCTLLAIVKTDRQELSSAPVGARVTDHEADVAGAQCYVEKDMETVSQAHVPIAFRWGALMEGLGGTGTAFIPSKHQCPHCLAIGIPFLADAVLTAAYIFWRDGLVYTSDSWTQGTETALCEKQSVAVGTSGDRL